MLINDHFQNYKRYGIPKCQLLIADVPYNLGNYAYASNPAWYKDGDNKNGESELAGKVFFDTDLDFRPAEFMHFCSTMLIPEPKGKKEAPCMVLFCEFEQQFYFIELARRYGLKNYINLVFRKNFSAQVLKANMKIVGNCEYGLVLYRNKLPKFRNNGKMIFNCIDWPRETKYEKIHPCLPAGQKVYFNNEWKNIEDIKPGDKNSYGSVIATTSHYAENLVKIKVGNDSIIATYNHPFLVKRENKIYWIEAEKITENDFILSKVFVYCTQKPTNKKSWGIKLHQRGICDMQKTAMDGLGLSILLFGKNIMDLFLLGCRYITKILTNKTITLKTCNLSHPLSTSGCTLVAELSMGYGKNLAKFVENLKNVMKRIGIFQEDGLMGKYVKNALSKNQLKSERYLLRKVGSVKIIKEKTVVYNLTISDTPVFDTLVGVSHNTQKPVELLETIIKIFTDEGDVVIDPVAGSGSTLIAADNLNRNAHGFEIKKDFHASASKWIEDNKLVNKEIREIGFAKTKLSKIHPTLFD